MSKEGEMIVYTKDDLDKIITWFRERDIYLEDWQVLKLRNKKEDPKLKEIFEGMD